MRPFTAIPRPGDRVADDVQLLALATFLADAAPRGRSLRLTWLDADERLLGRLVPVDDLPALPGPPVAGLGTLLASAIRQSAPGGSVVAVLQRPGDDAIGATDRAWNAAIRDQAREHGVRVRGVFVAAGGSVRPVTLDDALGG